MSAWDLLTVFDWITPAMGLLGDAAGDTGFTIAAGQQGAMEEALKRAMIRPYAVQIVGRDLMFNVPRNDAGRAKQALRWAGIDFDASR